MNAIYISPSLTDREFEKFFGYAVRKSETCTQSKLADTFELR